MSNEGKISIFRSGDAPRLFESGVMNMAPMSDEQMAGLMNMVEAGYADGEEVRILVDLPGFSLAHAWLKKEYPLLLHSHDSDCLYYVIAGSLQLGSERLVARDAFFVPAGAAYTYVADAEGVEVLEFRHTGRFEFKNLTKNPTFYEKARRTIEANVAGWREAKPPTEQRSISKE